VEVGFAIDLAAREGWNPGLNDAECFYAADPSGFLIGELGDDPVGCISAVSYAGRYGYLGLYIVRPEFRKRGFGRHLWQEALARLRGQTIGLDGAVARQSYYTRCGFHFAHRNVRYLGRAQPTAIHASICPATEVPLDAVSALDSQVFPERRDAFLRSWLTQPKAGAFVAREGERLSGYTVIRRCREGWKIGPLVADDPLVARRLYDAATAHVGHDEEIFIDVPEANPAAQSLVEALDLSPVFATARMYAGTDPTIDLGTLYGVTTFELG